jgi:glycogen operon protein
VEGPTDDQSINVARARQQRNFLATLFLSQGVPMLLGGDELGRIQQGNNNAYCQDNAISWYDWARADRGLVEFTRRLIAFQHDHPVFRRRRWFKGQPHVDGAAADIAWFKPDGLEMTEQDWTEWSAKSFMVFLNGDAISGRDRHGNSVRDESYCLLFNAHVDPVAFSVPGPPYGERWVPVIDTAQADAFGGGDRLDARATIERPGLSLQVLKRA